MNDKTLFDDLVKREQADDKMVVIAIEQIKVEDIVQPSQSMIDSIRDFGVLQPILVRLLGGKYQVIDGRRRTMACKQLEIENIPAIIRMNAEAMDGYALSIVTQVERSDNTLSEGRAIRELVKKGATKAQIMERLHLTSERYDKMLALSSLPDDVLKAVEQGTVAPSTAQKVAKLPQEYQKDALKKFKTDGKLTGKDVDEVKQVRQKKAVTAALSADFIPIPKSPVEIARAFIRTDPDSPYDEGWNAAIDVLIDALS